MISFLIDYVMNISQANISTGENQIKERITCYIEFELEEL
jgi:hypothetical protein